MAEAVRNHSPEVIVVDEIGTEEEAETARLIAQRGVQLVATAHGEKFEDLVSNKTLRPLIGGSQSIVPSADVAPRRRVSYEVLGPPTFGVLVEMQVTEFYSTSK